MPQANSTTSSPRWMSPLASARVLPCSEESSLARLSNSFCTSSRNLNRTRARRCGLVAAQAGCAASALAIACSTSDLLAKATLACTSPVLGLNTSPLRPEAPATCLPPMKWPIWRMVSSTKAGLRPRGVQPVLPPSDSAAYGLREDFTLEFGTSLGHYHLQRGRTGTIVTGRCRGRGMRVASKSAAKVE